MYIYLFCQFNNRALILSFQFFDHYLVCNQILACWFCIYFKDVHSSIRKTNLFVTSKQKTNKKHLESKMNTGSDNVSTSFLGPFTWNLVHKSVDHYEKSISADNMYYESTWWSSFPSTQVSTDIGLNKTYKSSSGASLLIQGR